MSSARTSLHPLLSAFFLLMDLTGCESDCSVRGKHYAIGEHFRDTDGCNTCTCTTEGAQCTLVECGPAANDERTMQDAALRAQCAEQTRRSSEALHAALSTVDNTCASDADCKLFYLGSDCYAGCGVVLSKQGKAAIEASSAAQADSVCRDFEARGCKRIIPPCDGPGTVACVEQQCRELSLDAPRLSAP